MHGCTDTFLQRDVLVKRAGNIPKGDASRNKLSNELRLLRDVNFTCNGAITSLLLGVDVMKTMGMRKKYPQVQAWREDKNTPRVYYRVYSEEIILAEGEFSPDGVLQYTLNPPIQFQTGDVLGVYQPEQKESVVQLYYKLENGAPTSLKMEFGKMDSPTQQMDIDTMDTLNSQVLLLAPQSCKSRRLVVLHNRIT